MTLILMTRIVDRRDTRSGFVFDWIRALADECERLIVVCQQKGEADGLPSNVVLRSFGKENGYGKVRQLASFCKILATSIVKADGVLAHMHPIYAICAWPF